MPAGPARRLEPASLHYALTIFLSALLLFQVQPMLARAVLPWFGGASSVWTVALLFFQVGLLGGYLYAHALTRFASPRLQRWIHGGLLLLSLALLPIVPREAWKPSPGADATWALLGLLAATVGLPYLLLSSTSPLLQSWHAGGSAAGDPGRTFRLFAVSNAGSLLALLTYPVLLEPLVGTRAQLLSWSAGYAVFCLLCTALALRTRGSAPAASDPALSAKPTPASRRLIWLGLAAVPTVLLMGVTSHLTQDVAPMPLLWVLPLALYLCSFIIPFAGDRWRWSRATIALPAMGLLALSLATARMMPKTDLPLLVTILCIGLFFACLFCHGELARLRPPTRELTGFYLTVAAGGALGGMAVSLAAPRLFRDYAELPLAIILCSATASWMLYRPRNGRWYDATFLLPTAPALILGVIGLSSRLAPGSNVRSQSRNFYGVLTVGDFAVGQPLARRALMHGTIVHGAQWLNPEWRLSPLTYYGPGSGIGLAVRALQARPSLRVGVVGLGTGSMAGFGRRGDEYVFYELDAAVERVARREFTFLSGSPARTQVRLGDARLTLETEPPQGFDLLVVDAFSSDAIPAHLITREAIRLYYRHLEGDGILALHISNRYLDLEPVCRAVLDAEGKPGRVYEAGEDSSRVLWPTTWVLSASRDELLNVGPLRGQGRALRAAGAVRAWTDDYSSLWRIMRR